MMFASVGSNVSFSVHFISLLSFLTCNISALNTSNLCTSLHCSIKYFLLHGLKLFKYYPIIAIFELNVCSIHFFSETSTVPLAVYGGGIVVWLTSFYRLCFVHMVSNLDFFAELCYISSASFYFKFIRVIDR